MMYWFAVISLLCLIIIVRGCKCDGFDCCTIICGAYS